MFLAQFNMMECRLATIPMRKEFNYGMTWTHDALIRLSTKVLWEVWFFTLTLNLTLHLQ
jgi:hypothetical protein